MDKNKLKKTNKVLYSFSFFFFILSLFIFLAAGKLSILEEEIFYSIGLFFVFLLLFCMALILFLNGFYEIKNPDWFLRKSKNLLTKEPKEYYRPETVFGSALDIHTKKFTFKLKAVLKLSLGVGIFVFAVAVFIFATRLL